MKNSLAALEQGIELGQEGAIARVFPVIPEREREPGAAHLPHAPEGAVDGRGRAPDDRCCDAPPSRARRTCSCATFAPVTRELLRHAQQRLDTFTQRRRARGPVVHLRVDVDGPLAAPGRIGPLVPDPLQVGRLRTRARARQQQVAAELEIQRRSARDRAPSRSASRVRRWAAARPSLLPRSQRHARDSVAGNPPRGAHAAWRNRIATRPRAARG